MKQRIAFLLLVGMCALLPGLAQEGETGSKKVLWLGTAISGYHNLDQQIVEVISGPEGLGELQLEDVYVWPIAQLFMADDDPEKRTHPSLQKRDEILAFLEEEKPGYLVIQTTLNYFQDDPGRMPEVVERLTQAAQAQGTEVIFYETGWPTSGGLEKEKQAQNALAEKLGATVVPCWTVQEVFRQELPDLDWTYNGDRRHPGKYFIYLNKLVFTGTLTQKPLESVPTTYPYRKTWKDEDGKNRKETITFTLPEEDAQRIRETVKKALNQTSG